MELFPDQGIVLEQAREKLRQIKPIGRRPRILVQAPCGFGKTAVAAYIAKSVMERGLQSWFICHRDFLLSQTSKTFDDVGIEHSYMAAGREFNQHAKTQIGMIGSLKSRACKIDPPTVAIWDECHHMGAKTWAERMNAMPDTIHIGLSATPMRTDKIGLEAFFDELVLGPTVAELISKKRLSDYHYFTPSKPDLSNVHIRMGEYVTTELDEEMTKAKIIGDIVWSYKKHANGTRAVYFATSVNTSKRYAAAFNDAGISSVHLDADSSASERKQAAIDMAMGRLQIITNVGLFGEGFDLAAHAGMPVTIETVGLCRPTKSLPLLIQQQMRCMRAKEYPGIILDHAGCYAEHDFLPDDAIEWSLKGAKRNELVGTFQCQGCGATLRRSASLCSYCGEDNSKRIAEVKARKEAEHIAGELSKVERENRERQDKIQRGMAKSLEELIKFGREKGYKNPHAWARFVHQSRERKKRGW
jgi:DNA repair protein RadD